MHLFVVAVVDEIFHKNIKAKAKFFRKLMKNNQTNIFNVLHLNSKAE